MFFFQQRTRCLLEESGSYARVYRRIVLNAVGDRPVGTLIPNRVENAAIPVRAKSRRADQRR
jgi:hypothetical protein